MTNPLIFNPENTSAHLSFPDGSRSEEWTILEHAIFAIEECCLLGKIAPHTRCESIAAIYRSQMESIILKEGEVDSDAFLQAFESGPRHMHLLPFERPVYIPCECGAPFEHGYLHNAIGERLPLIITMKEVGYIIVDELHTAEIITLMDAARLGADIATDNAIFSKEAIDAELN